MGAGEIWITPSKGMSSSRIRKIAPATESAASITATMTVAFGGANRTTHENNRQPRDQNDQHGKGYGCLRLLEQQPAHLTEISGDLNGLRLERALHIVLRREVLDCVKERLARGYARIQLRSLRRFLVRPHTINRTPDRATEELTGLRGFRAVIGQHSVEEDDLGRHLAHLTLLGVVRPLG